jgi:tetratricopeptide (TPR) repeat protein
MLSLVALDSLDPARRAVEEPRAQENRWGGYALLMALKGTAEIAIREDSAGAALDALDGMRSFAISFGGFFDIEYREAYARAYLLAGRLEEAADVHREMLRVYGGHALLHHELGKLYEEMGRAQDAAREYAVFLDMWSQAAEGLPQPEEAKTRLAAPHRTSQLPFVSPSHLPLHLQLQI